MTSFIDAINAHNERMIKMTVQDQVVFMMKEAMKSGDTALRDLMRVVMGEFSREGKVLADEQALKVIKKMHENAVELGNKYEEKILVQWVPAELGPTQTKVLVAGIINKNGYSGIQDMGKIMGELKKTSGVNMKLAGQMAKELL